MIKKVTFAATLVTSVLLTGCFDSDKAPEEIAPVSEYTLEPVVETIAEEIAPEIVEQVLTNGKVMYNNLGCSGCHGAGGNSVIPSYPSLAGKDASWIFQQLKDFQSGARIDATMNAMAPMAEGHEQAIADYLSNQ